MMKNKKVFLVVILLMLLCGCSHKHNWKEATCVDAKICVECQETEGDSLGHTWREATCSNPKECMICGIKEGNPLNHEWIEADCVHPKVCSVCGKNDGKELGHKWTEATCIKPKTCELCGAVEGITLEHDWEEASCTEAPKCKICDYVEGNPLGHDWIEATCLEKKHCSRCDISEGKELGHNIDNTFIDIFASCTTDGQEHGFCTRCGERIVSTIEKKGHKPGEWTIEKEATYLESGIIKQFCENCKYELSSQEYFLSVEEIQEAVKNDSVEVSYDQLVREPNELMNSCVKLTGKIMSKYVYDDRVDYTISITKGFFWRDLIYVSLFNQYIEEPRALEDDIVLFYGLSSGIIADYQIFGDNGSLPYVVAVSMKVEK